MCACRLLLAVLQAIVAGVLLLVREHLGELGNGAREQRQAARDEEYNKALTDRLQKTNT